MREFGREAHPVGTTVDNWSWRLALVPVSVSWWQGRTGTCDLWVMSKARAVSPIAGDCICPRIAVSWARQSGESLGVSGVSLPNPLPAGSVSATSTTSDGAGRRRLPPSCAESGRDPDQAARLAWMGGEDRPSLGALSAGGLWGPPVRRGCDSIGRSGHWSCLFAGPRLLRSRFRCRSGHMAWALWSLHRRASSRSRQTLLPERRCG